MNRNIVMAEISTMRQARIRALDGVRPALRYDNYPSMDEVTTMLGITREATDKGKRVSWDGSMLPESRWSLLNTSEQDLGDYTDEGLTKLVARMQKLNEEWLESARQAVIGSGEQRIEARLRRGKLEELGKEHDLVIVLRYRERGRWTPVRAESFKRQVVKLFQEGVADARVESISIRRSGSTAFLE